MKPDEYRRPAFPFESSEQTGHLECRFDDDPFEPCDQSSTDGLARRGPARRAAVRTASTRSRSRRSTATGTDRRRRADIHHAPYNGDLELELSEPGVPGSIRGLAAWASRRSSGARSPARWRPRSRSDSRVEGQVPDARVRPGDRWVGPRGPADRRRAVGSREAGAGEGEARFAQDRAERRAHRWRRSGTGVTSRLELPKRR